MPYLRTQQQTYKLRTQLRALGLKPDQIARLAFQRWLYEHSRYLGEYPEEVTKDATTYLSRFC